MDLELEALPLPGLAGMLTSGFPCLLPRAMVSSGCFAAGTACSVACLSVSVHAAERKRSCALCSWGPGAWAAALACWPHKAALRGAAYESDGQS